MILELINGHKNILVFSFLLSLFAITILSLGVDQPIELITANKKAISWLFWGAFYILAQFVVALFVGRIIGGSKRSEYI